MKHETMSQALVKAQVDRIRRQISAPAETLPRPESRSGFGRKAAVLARIPIFIRRALRLP